MNVASLESNTDSTGNTSTATNSASNSATNVPSNDSRVSLKSKSNAILGDGCDASTNNCKSTMSNSSAEREETSGPFTSHSIQNQTVPAEINPSGQTINGQTINETPNTDTINSDVNFDTLIDASEYVPDDANISSTENSQFDEIFNPQRKN